MLEMPCNFAGMFHSGSHNIFRRLVTTEIRPQQMFIIRIPLIPDSCVDPRESKTWWTNVEDNCLLSEIATMRWVQENSQIPVPKVIAFDNEVGAAGVPWVLMEAVKGHPYTEVKPHTLASNGEPTEQQQEKVRQAVAWVQVNPPFSFLSSHRADEDRSNYQEPPFQGLESCNYTRTKLSSWTHSRTSRTAPSPVLATSFSLGRTWWAAALSSFASESSCQRWMKSTVNSLSGFSSCFRTSQNHSQIPSASP